MKQIRKFIWMLVTMMMVLFVGCSGTGNVEKLSVPEISQAASSDAKEQASADTDEKGIEEESETPEITEDGQYTSKEEVAEYVHQYGHLPENFISKTKARKLGWDSKEGNLWEVAPGKSIGGSQFKNYDGTLPDKPGRTWTECDIDYQGGYREAKRLIFSNDGLIFYTEDHYQTFEQLY
ncbi:MAG: ribonuclease domain-containing protein [Blautia sp.]|jgi:ribonuclease T1